MALLRQRLRATPGAVLEVAAGVHRREHSFEFFAAAIDSALRPAAIVRFAQLPRSLEGISHHWWEGFDVPRGDRPRIDVFLHEERGASAAVLVSGRVLPLGELLIVGPRMERWIPSKPPPELMGEVPADGPMSRYIGALGGREVLLRLQSLRIAIVGSARLASGLAIGLARAGVAEITLIDPDILEEHSRDAMEVLARSRAGIPKVHAVAEMLRAIAPEVSVIPLPVPIEHPLAVEHCAGADVLMSAPDRNAPRLLAALIAAAFLRPHIDIGTGVFRERGQLIAGADLRLTIPGNGCLWCVGSLDLERRHDVDWRRQRAGSLRSLNSLAVAHAQFLLERFVIGDVEASTWLQTALDERAILSPRRMPRAVMTDCPICSLAGRGDEALPTDLRASRPSVS